MHISIKLCIQQINKFVPLWEEHHRAGPGEHVHFNEGQSSRSAQAQINVLIIISR